MEANLALGFRDDERDYAVAAHMLMSLKIQSVRLMTNNPKKIQQLNDYGVKVSERIPHILPTNEHNRFYLETKAAKSGHMIDFHGKEHLPEQSDQPIVEGMKRWSKAMINALSSSRAQRACLEIWLRKLLRNADTIMCLLDKDQDKLDSLARDLNLPTSTLHPSH